MSFVRGVCVVAECERLQRIKGTIDGRTIYGTKCHFHHKKTYMGVHILQRFPNKQCSRCGWDKAPCDRHRIEPSKGYVEGNVIILCPNCHRIEESNKHQARLRGPVEL